jgi:hypothetical protein
MCCAVYALPRAESGGRALTVRCPEWVYVGRTISSSSRPRRDESGPKTAIMPMPPLKGCATPDPLFQRQDYRARYRIGDMATAKVFERVAKRIESCDHV